MRRRTLEEGRIRTGGASRTQCVHREVGDEGALGIILGGISQEWFKQLTLFTHLSISNLNYNPGITRGVKCTPLEDGPASQQWETRRKTEKLSFPPHQRRGTENLQEDQ